MQRIFSALGQAFRNSILILVTVSLLSLSNLFIFANQPAYAATSSSANINRTSDPTEDASMREEAYEEAAEQARNPDKQDEIYNESVKANKGPQAENGLVEGAKELVEKVTGQGDSK
ncbi:hypothetical protein [Coleofasciculus sp. H7-2]|uniref:hypothetical protein n=1 Tax=Coleofasciculus sp. H7-2 TaxID=3351545 RepID=UPI00366B92E0